jgi:hypothetical protein
MTVDVYCRTESSAVPGVSGRAGELGRSVSSYPPYSEREAVDLILALIESVTGTIFSLLKKR